MISRHAEGAPCGDGVHHESDNARRIGTPIDQVADKYYLPPIWVADGITAAIHRDRIAQLTQQFQRLIETTVNVADNVERSAFGPFVVPERLPDNCKPAEFLRRLEY